MIKYFPLAALFAGLLAVSLPAQPLKITTTVNQTQVAVNQQLVFTIEMTGEAAQRIDQPELPDMGGYLSFLGAGGTSQNISFVNGKMSVSKSFTYYYLAAKEGTFTIPAVKVLYQNNEYASDPISMTITKGVTPAQPQARTPGAAPEQNEGAASSEDLYVRTIVSKRQVYQNEPVFVTYKIYAAVSVANYGISKLPETAGFWSEDIEMPQQPQGVEEVINGKRYIVYEIKKMAVFPTSAGKKTIGQFALQCQVRVQSRARSRDLFDSFFDDAFLGRTVMRHVAAPAVEIDVLPLPENGKPADFAGAVGQYNLLAAVDKNNVSTDEAVTLKVTVSGTGNIRMLPKPDVQIPADFEQYEPKETENLNRQNGSISGSKTYEYVLVPRFPGEQHIRPVQFSYFDPKTRAYKTLASDEIVINVTKGKGQFVAAGGSGLSKEEVRYVGQDIRFIKMALGNLQPANNRIYDSFGFFAALVLPLLALGAAYGYKNHTDKLSGNVAYARSRRANSLAMKRLATAKSLLHVNSQKEFYAEVANALTGFAADKMNKAKAGLISDDLEKEFNHRQIDPALTKEYFALIRTCDFQRFAPSTVDLPAMQQSYQEAKEVIIRLEKAL